MTHVGLLRLRVAVHVTREGRLAAVVGGSGGHEGGICGQDAGQALVLEDKLTVNRHNENDHRSEMWYNYHWFGRL